MARDRVCGVVFRPVRVLHRVRLAATRDRPRSRRDVVAHGGSNVNWMVGGFMSYLSKMSACSLVMSALVIPVWFTDSALHLYIFFALLSAFVATAFLWLYFFSKEMGWL